MTTTKNRPVFATFMLLLLCVVWGGTFPATKSALSLTDPIHFLALRFGMAVILTTPFFIPHILRSPKDIDNDPKPATVLLRGIFVGIFLFLGFALQVLGLQHTTASRSGFFTGMLVVMTPPLALLFKTSKMPRAAWLGIPIAVLGIYFMADPGSGGLNLGDWLTISCAFVFALQMIALEFVAGDGKYTGLLMYGQMLVVFIGALIWSLIAGNPFQISGTGWLAVVYTGLFGSIAATWLQTKYQPQVPAGYAALIFTAEPIFASLFAWLLLNELWSGRSLIGAGLILMAMVVSGVKVVYKKR
ncbi:DMT family transporter [bacterium]|nr:DMT family transporter [bacterium]